MVKYEWDESNGVSVPTNKLMAIDADEYYVGMPLKKVDAETVAPTDGDPEYICLAQRNAGDEIRPLQIPVQEVFPDAVYTKIMEDGTEEKVKFGGGGTSKIKPEQLPDGYPYMGVEEKTVEHIPTEQNGGFTPLEGFPVFAVGDTVNIKVNGVKYSLVAFDFNGMTMIGDAPSDIMSGGGQYGWCALVDKLGEVAITSVDNFVVSWEVPVAVPMAEEFLPDTIARTSDIAEVVKTVNGAAPDENGNVVVETAGCAIPTGTASATNAVAVISTAEATAISAVAVGTNAKATASQSQAYGLNAQATGIQAMAFGPSAKAGDYATAVGASANAAKNSSFAFGAYAEAHSEKQMVIGRYNVSDDAGKYRFIIGNGGGANARANAMTIDANHAVVFKGTVEAESMILHSSTEGSTKKFKITVDDNGTITATEV